MASAGQGLTRASPPAFPSPRTRATATRARRPDFFQAWLGGTLPATDAVYARLSDTQAPEFVIVTPGGELIPSERLLAQLRAAHGSRPGWRMWIENAELRLTQGELTVATYEEWQQHADGAVTGRLSTVIFRDQPGTPNGLAWVHVHETWLPEAVQRRGRS